MLERDAALERAKLAEDQRRELEVQLATKDFELDAANKDFEEFLRSDYAVRCEGRWEETTSTEGTCGGGGLDQCPRALRQMCTEVCWPSPSSLASAARAD